MLSDDDADADDSDCPNCERSSCSPDTRVFVLSGFCFSFCESLSSCAAGVFRLSCVCFSLLVCFSLRVDFSLFISAFTSASQYSSGGISGISSIHTSISSSTCSFVLGFEFVAGVSCCCDVLIFVLTVCTVFMSFFCFNVCTFVCFVSIFVLAFACVRLLSSFIISDPSSSVSSCFSFFSSSSSSSSSVRSITCSSLLARGLGVCCGFVS